MSLRPASAPALVGFCLFAGILQIFATILLGLARLDAFHRAAAEGSGFYLLGAFATGLGLVVVWLLRARPLVAVLVFLIWQLMVYWPLAQRTSPLGLAYHGEYIAHHFTALLAAAACLTVVTGWARRRELGPMRLIPAALGGAGTVATLGVHLLSLPSVDVRVPSTVAHIGVGALLAAPALALGLFWASLRPAGLRIVVAVLLAPLLLRIGFAFPGALSGEAVPQAGRPFVMAAVVVAAASTFVIYRPRIAVRLRIGVTVLAGLLTSILYVVYRRNFGELEDAIGGLAQSLFGFALPYPNYVPGWQITVVTLGVFFILSTVGAALVSSNERDRGVAMALLMVAGLGLTNAQLGLMVGAALLLLVDTLTHDDPNRPVPPPTDLESILETTAHRLALPSPVVLEGGSTTVVALRGDIGGTPLDLRARPRRSGGWELSVRTGIVGRSRPDAELVPDDGDEGRRPAHRLGRSHRVEGSMRVLEGIGDPLLDALSPFETARARFWEAGTHVELGRDLSRLDAAALAALLSELCKR